MDYRTCCLEAMVAVVSLGALPVHSGFSPAGCLALTPIVPVDVSMVAVRSGIEGWSVAVDAFREPLAVSAFRQSGLCREGSSF